MTVPSVTYKQLRRRIRPARVATVFPGPETGWEHAALRMLENYSITWGGSGNLLLPVEDDGQIEPRLWEAAELFDADVWAGYALTLRGHKRANPQAFESWLEDQAKQWVEKHGGTLASAREALTADHVLDETVGGWPVPSEVGEAVARRTGAVTESGVVRFGYFRAGGLPGEYMACVLDLQPLPPLVRMIDTSQLPIALQLIVASRFGALAPEHVERLHALGVATEDVEIRDEQDLDVLMRVAWLGPTGRSGFRSLQSNLRRAHLHDDEAARDFLASGPFGLSRIGCREMTRFDPTAWDRPRVLVVGDRAADFAYAHALERCGVFAIWLPMEIAAGSDSTSELLIDCLASCLSNPGQRDLEDTPIHVCSLSLDSDQLGQACERVRGTLWGTDLKDMDVVERAGLPPHRAPTLLDPTHYDDILEEPVERDVMVRSVPVATPSAVSAADPWKISWWVEVEDPRSQLPPRTALNELVAAETQSWRAVARTGRDGVAFYSHTMGFTAAGTPLEQVAERPRLRFPSAGAVFTHLFERAGYEIRESAAGRFRRMTTALWGGHDPLHLDLIDESRFTLLRAWLSDAPSGETAGARLGGRRYLSFEDLLDVSQIAPEALRSLIDSYLERSILRRGLALKCSECLHFGWYPFDEVGQGFRCRRCETGVLVTAATWRGGHEPAYYYDLAEVVTQALAHDVHVPVRAIAGISSGASSFDEMSEVEVAKGQTRMEIDLLTLVDGRIVIGEAKLGDRLQDTKRKEESWLRKMIRVAEEITADEVVLATASQWRGETRNRIAAAAENTPVAIRMMENV